MEDFNKFSNISITDGGIVILEYAKQNYKKMLREPNGALKYKYIVPGSVYKDSLWDWDSWLTNIALSQFADFDISEYEKGCILNFLEAIDQEGRIPIVILPNFNKDDFADEKGGNIHKPCLAQHAVFIVDKQGNSDWLKPHFLEICRFVDYYINNCRHKTGLYFWLDDSAIGVDNDPCTFYRPRKSSASIFLNCLMYKELLAVCRLGEIFNTDVSKYALEAENLKEAVRRHCYDEKDGFYYSVDLNLLPIDPESGKHKGAPRNWECLLQRIGCWSGFLAMWSGIATEEQAKRMVKENLLDENSFWAPFGVRTLSKYEKMYQISATGNPSCWLGPIWGISNYLVFEGLVNYGFSAEARELADKTIKMFEKDLSECGDLHEYYHPETGDPIMNKGFQNWNLLAINMKI